MAVGAGTSRAPSGAAADRTWALGGLLGSAVGLAVVAAVFGPAAAVILLAGLACAAASLPVVARRPRRTRRPVELRAGTQARVFDADLERVSAVVSVRPLAAAPMPKQARPEPVAAPRPAEPVAAPRPAPPPIAPPSPSAAGDDDPADAYRRGGALEKAGDLAAAEQAYARATAGGHRLAALSLGQLLQARGRPDEAVSCFRRAAEGTDSLAGTAALSLGVLLASRGDERGATAAYERAVRCGGGAGESAKLLLRWLQRRREAA